MNRVYGLLAFAVTACAVAAACSSNFYVIRCTSDADCGSGLVCVAAGSYCKDASLVPITLGMSVPLTGPVQDLGARMLAGVSLAFSEQNGKGGVRGRTLLLDAKDDESNPALAQSNTATLVDAQDDVADAPNCPTTQNPPNGATTIGTHRIGEGPRGVLSMIGSVGTPTTIQGAMFAIETQTLVFAPHTGSQSLLRDDSAGPCARFVFNVRPSFAWEAQALVAYFANRKIKDSQHIFSFDQQKALGDEGYRGLTSALGAMESPFATSFQPPQQDIGGRFRYAFGDDTSVTAAIADLETALMSLVNKDPAPSVPVGIFIVATYGPSAALVQGLRDWQNKNLSQLSRLQLYFGAESPIVLDSFIARLRDAGNGGTYVDNTTGTPITKAYWQDVVASQTVPNYQTDPGDLVKQYLGAAAQFGVTPTSTSLEGYLAGRLFVAGLLKHEGSLDSASLIPTFESLGNLWTGGLGAHAGFGPGNHQYLKSVWGVKVDSEGKFTNVFYWEYNPAGPPNQFAIFG